MNIHTILETVGIIAILWTLCAAVRQTVLRQRLKRQVEKLGKTWDEFQALRRRHAEENVA